MPANVPNFDLLLAAVLREAKRQPDPIGYLDAQHRAAWAAVQAGDEFVHSMSDESGSSSATRELPAMTLMQLYELALQALEVQPGQASPDVRVGDFSRIPCLLG